MDTMDTNDSSTWQILRYHFPNESEVDEFHNDWWQVLRNGAVGARAGGQTREKYFAAC